MFGKGNENEETMQNNSLSNNECAPVITDEGAVDLADALVALWKLALPVIIGLALIFIGCGFAELTPWVTLLIFVGYGIAVSPTMLLILQGNSIRELLSAEFHTYAIYSDGSREDITDFSDIASGWLMKMLVLLLGFIAAVYITPLRLFVSFRTFNQVKKEQGITNLPFKQDSKFPLYVLIGVIVGGIIFAAVATAITRGVEKGNQTASDYSEAEILKFFDDVQAKSPTEYTVYNLLGYAIEAKVTFAPQDRKMVRIEVERGSNATPSSTSSVDYGTYFGLYENEEWTFFLSDGETELSDAGDIQDLSICLIVSFIDFDMLKGDMENVALQNGQYRTREDTYEEGFVLNYFGENKMGPMEAKNKPDWFSPITFQFDKQQRVRYVEAIGINSIFIEY